MRYSTATIPQSGEMMTSEGGDGRFFGKVYATHYSGLPKGRELFLVVGETEKKVQIVKIRKHGVTHPDRDGFGFGLVERVGVRGSGLSFG